MTAASAPPPPAGPAPAGDRFGLTVRHVDARCAARAGTLHTLHGPVDLPAFMPVATQATVKGVIAPALQATGAQMVLANTYHLLLRPGEDVVRDLGGLHEFMRWSGPILTDSGGFQVFSLAQMTKVTEDGVLFRSHIDGSPVRLSPERAIAVQEALGADVAMALDHVIALPNSRDAIADAMQRSVRWARRCRDAARRPDQALFGIVQGGLEEDLRMRSAEQLVALDFPGYAIGGLSVGEPPPAMYAVLDYAVPALPADKPRYLMGVGRPQDLLEAVRRGIDLFDCVMPTRNGRNAFAFTDRGPIRVRNKKFERDSRPLDERCPCPACRHSLGYLRHLFQAGEMTGPILLSQHNLTYYQRLLAGAREAIVADRFFEYCEQKYAGWLQGNDDRPRDV